MTDAAAELAPGGTLRAGINTANFLLVTGTSPGGEPDGVAPDVARAIGARLDVPVALAPFANASLVADAVGRGVCDIGLIGAEPARAETLAFTAAYAGIEATYRVRADSGLDRVADVDRPGVRISVAGGSAYDLWLSRHIRHAELVRSDSIAASCQRFVDDGLEALAGLRAGLIGDAMFGGSKLLDGHFTTVQQAVATALGKPAGSAFLSAFVEEARQSGLVAGLIAKHRVEGLTAL